MATDILPDFLDWADQGYACGPLEMYKAPANMSLRAKTTYPVIASEAKQSLWKEIGI